MITTKMPKVRFHYSIIVYLFAGFLKDFLLIMSILAFHELGHIIWILIFRGRINKLSISLIGGLMNIELPTNKLLTNLFVICGRPG